MGFRSSQHDSEFVCDLRGSVGLGDGVSLFVPARRFLVEGARGACREGGHCAASAGGRMYSAGSQQSMQSSNVAGASSSSSTSGSNVTRPNPSPPMTPGRQQASPSPLVQQPSAPAAASLAVRGRYRELQQLNNEMQLLQVSHTMLWTPCPN